MNNSIVAGSDVRDPLFDVDMNTSSNDCFIPDINSTDNVNLSCGETGMSVSGSLFLLYKIFWTAMIPGFALLGIIGNILSIKVLYRCKLFNTRIILILNIADLAYLALIEVSTFFKVFKLYHPEEGQIWHTRIVPYLLMFLGPLPGRYAHVLIVFITIERFIAIAFPLKVKLIFTRKFTSVVLIVLFLFVLILMFPKLFMYEVSEISAGGNLSVYLRPTDFRKSPVLFNIYYSTCESLLQIAPIVVVTIFNIMNIGLLRRNTYTVRKLCYLSKTSLIRKELKVTKVLLTLSFVFLVCLIPGGVFRVLILLNPRNEFYSEQNHMYRIVIMVTTFLEVVNSSVNILIYVVMSGTLRERFKQITVC